MSKHNCIVCGRFCNAFVYDDEEKIYWCCKSNHTHEQIMDLVLPDKER